MFILISNLLKKRDVFEDAERLGSGNCLTLVFHNCSRQNKNCIVLQYALPCEKRHL